MFEGELMNNIECVLIKVNEDLEGDALYEKTALRSQATKDALVAIGCEIYPQNPANSMTTIYSENAPEIRKILKKFLQVLTNETALPIMSPS